VCNAMILSAATCIIKTESGREIGIGRFDIVSYCPPASHQPPITRPWIACTNNYSVAFKPHESMKILHYRHVAQGNNNNNSRRRSGGGSGSD
jgi:hypothetical protein